MIEREVEIKNRLGLHARAAAKLVHTASGYRADVKVVRGGEEVDGKSILGILLLAAEQGSKIAVRCDGDDEDEALRAITGLIDNRFDEDG